MDQLRILALDNLSELCAEETAGEAAFIRQEPMHQPAVQTEMVPATPRLDSQRLASEPEPPHDATGYEQPEAETRMKPALQPAARSTKQ